MAGLSVSPPLQLGPLRQARLPALAIKLPAIHQAAGCQLHYSKQATVSWVKSSQQLGVQQSISGFRLAFGWQFCWRSSCLPATSAAAFDKFAKSAALLLLLLFIIYPAQADSSQYLLLFNIIYLLFKHQLQLAPTLASI